MQLGVNIDHIAVLREARKINDPDPLDAVGIVKRAGGDQITIHLREDRRHINDDDARRIMENATLPINLECACDEAMIEIACKLNPYRVTLVPEKREEVTTEGGLDLIKNFQKVDTIAKQLKDAHIELSVFIDPNAYQIKMAKSLQANWIELHTGSYANIYAMLFSNLAKTKHSIDELELPRDALHIKLKNALEELDQSAKSACSLGLKVAAGHGLNYQNVTNICAIKEITELNIGQSIIARSIFCGLEQAIKDMRDLLV
ncbi:MAG: pyridoxine 5'-phosphate synthase [Sulfurospirillum sp.]|nr:pyridoxine 5'-phosphate synthase [Sulfurospirillum sp.]